MLSPLKSRESKELPYNPRACVAKIQNVELSIKLFILLAIGNVLPPCLIDK